ncbi:MAG: DUF2470 domain-containing protein [Pseudomonadota bacterium]
MTENSLPDAAQRRIIEHMNDDHADACLLYARVFANCASATAARITSIAPTAMQLTCTVSGGEETVEVPFEPPLANAEDAHHRLVAMVREAREIESSAGKGH